MPQPLHAKVLSMRWGIRACGADLKRIVGAIVATSLVTLTGVGLPRFAHAADLPVKAPPKPVAAPVWWVSGAALLWKVKSDPLPPTLTTFIPGSPSAAAGSGGELGVPGTIVLSPDHLGYGPFGGGRFSVGRWLADPRFAIEAEGFFLGSKSASFGQFSNSSTALFVPFNNPPPGAGFPLGSSSFLLSFPGFASGGQSITSALKLWGAESNGIYRAYSSSLLNVSVLGGVRYIDLRENLSIFSTENILSGVPVIGGAAFSGTDNFSTKNQFFGAQVGVKAQTQYGPFDGSVTAKVALGDNYQTVAINGFSSQVGFGGVPAAAPSAPGAIFSQITNIGVQNRNQFAVAPEMQLQGSYRLQNGIRLFAGYDFIYISNVVRPGDQIDTTVNFTGNPVVNGVGTTLTGAARPAPQFNGSSFWAQGFKLGASYAF